MTMMLLIWCGAIFLLFSGGGGGVNSADLPTGAATGAAGGLDKAAVPGATGLPTDATGAKLPSTGGAAAGGGGLPTDAATSKVPGGVPSTDAATGAVPGGVPSTGSLPATPPPTDKLAGAAGEVGGSCFAKQPAPVTSIDEKWVTRFGQLGLYNRMSSKLIEWGSTLHAPPPPSSPTAKHTVCWDVKLKTPLGEPGQLDATQTTCTYDDDIAKEMCALSTTNIDVLAQFKHYGAYTIIKYQNSTDDNKSYLLIYCCLMGKDNYFFLLMKQDKSSPLDEALKTELKSTVMGLGFTEDTIIYDADDIIAIEHVKIGSCPAGSPLPTGAGAGGGLGELPVGGIGSRSGEAGGAGAAAGAVPGLSTFKSIPKLG